MGKPVKKTKQSESDDFVPDSTVSSGAANYMKLDTGTNKIRMDGRGR